MTRLSVRSVNPIFLRLRQRMAEECARHSPFKGNLEADESYFGPRCVRGKRGRGAGAKTIVFGLLKRDDKVYTEIVPNVTKPTLRAVIRGHADLPSVIHTDGWMGYDGLVDLGYARHHRVSHGDNQFALGANHINERHRELLGICQASADSISWRQPERLPSPFEGNRISLQSQTPEPLQSPAILAQKGTALTAFAS